MTSALVAVAFVGMALAQAAPSGAPAIPSPPTASPPTASPPTASPPTASPPTPSCADLRAIDWKNHAYPLVLAGRLRDGVAEVREYMELGGLHDTTMWSLREVVYGDLDGDGCAEAVTVLSAAYHPPSGASREWTEAWVWRAGTGGPAAAPGGGEVALGRAEGAAGATVRVADAALSVGDTRWRVRGGVLVKAP